MCVPGRPVQPGTGGRQRRREPARTLAERQRTHEQNKARLAEAEAKLREAERKQRTRRLVEAGALADKAGLLELDSNALYGALLSLRDEGKEPVLLSFPGPLGKDATGALRTADFRFSKAMQHWEGLARFEDVEALAKQHGGAARRVNGDAPVEAAADA